MTRTPSATTVLPRGAAGAPVRAGAMPRVVRTLLIGGGVALSAACTVLPEAAPPPARMDFGPPPASAPGAPTVELRGVTAPDWLQTTEIAYRMLHQAPHERRTYARHTWLAPPTALLAERLRAKLEAEGASGGGAASGNGPGASTALRLELTRFEQVFESPGEAVAVVRLRATRFDGNGPVRRTFTSRRATAPDVQGAIEGLSAAADAVLEELLRWAAEAS